MESLNCPALLATLKAARDVELAVVVGSRGRGEQNEESDLDLLVSLGHLSEERWAELEARLERAAEIPVDLCSLVAWAQVPMFWHEAIEKGGAVLVDRFHHWDGFRAEPEAAPTNLVRPYGELADHDQRAVRWMKAREARKAMSVAATYDYLAWCEEWGLEPWERRAP